MAPKPRPRALVMEHGAFSSIDILEIQPVRIG
jgi:hypothetical protein